MQEMKLDILLGRFIIIVLRVPPGFPLVLTAECEWTDKLKESLNKKGIITGRFGKFSVHPYFNE